MVLGRRELGAILLGIAAIVFYLVLLSTTPSGAQTGGGTNGTTSQNGSDAGCDNPEEVDVFSGDSSQITPSFEITGDTFRLSLEADLVQEGEFGFILIDSVDEDDGLTVPFGGIFVNPVEGPTNQSANVLEGPGTFSLEIEVENVDYTVIVEDCTGTSGNGTTGNNNNRTTNQNQYNTQNQNAPRERSVINVPNKPLPPSGGLPVYGVVAGFILTGAGLLALGFGIRRSSS